MSFLNSFKQLFGFGNPSLGSSQQLTDINPTTGLAMVPGTLHDVGGNNLGTSLSSDCDDQFNSLSMAQPFDLGGGYSDFDSF